MNYDDFLFRQNPGRFLNISLDSNFLMPPSDARTGDPIIAAQDCPIKMGKSKELMHRRLYTKLFVKLLLIEGVLVKLDPDIANLFTNLDPESMAAIQTGSQADVIFHKRLIFRLSQKMICHDKKFTSCCASQS